MPDALIAAQRLRNEWVTTPKGGGPAEVVRWLGAVQAQEYAFAKWALALRMRDETTDARIERAFQQGHILRTHVMRPTWHFVAPADIRWMLELTAPRVKRAVAYYDRQLELERATLNRALDVFERALGDRTYLTRVELGAHLERAGIRARGQRLAHIAMHAELEGVVCSGPRRGKQFTYALLADRAPSARRLPRDESLGELTRRFFRSHGPATIRDFVWWSGLTAADARRGLESNRARPSSSGGLTYWTIGRAPASAPSAARVHLLPIYDEYLVPFRDRDAVPHGPMTAVDDVTFQHALVIDGQVAGTWRRAGGANGCAVQVFPTRRLTAPERRAILRAVRRYGSFVGAPASVSIR